MSKFEIAQHSFTSTIIEVLQKHFGEYAKEVFSASPILGYLNNKTKAANKGSKARGAFATRLCLLALNIVPTVKCQMNKLPPNQSLKAFASLTGTVQTGAASHYHAGSACPLARR